MAGTTGGSAALQGDGPNRVITSGDTSGDNPSQPKSFGYRQIMQSVNNSMRSDFTGQALTPNGESPKERRNNIAASLRNAENDAGNAASTSALDANSGEKDVSSDAAQTASDFTNKVGQKGGSESGEKGGGGGNVKSGFLKKKGPLMSIIISLLFGGGGMYMTQASLPFTLLDKINDTFDSINISTNVRSKGLMRALAKNSVNIPDTSKVTKKNIFGKEKFAPTRKMKKKLAANGISFGSKKTGDAGKMIFTNADGVTKKMTVAEFKTEFDANPEFRKAYSKGTRNWKTSIEEFKDGVFDKLLKRFNISKNRFADYDAKDDPDGEKGMKKMASDVDASTNGEDITTRTSKTKQTEVETDATDADGNPIKKTQTDIENDAPKTETGVKGQKAKSVADKLGAVKDVVGSLTTIGCGITKAYTALKLILAAAQLAQVVAVAQEMFEGIDKARAGDAASSPINAIGRSLVEQASETKETVDEVSIGSDNAEVTYKEETTEARSAIQSEGLSSLFTGDPIDANDKSVASFVPNKAAQNAIDAVGNDVTSALSFGNDNIKAIEDAILKFGGSSIDLLSTSIMSYRTCLVMDSVMAAIDLGIAVASLVEFIAGIFTAGTTSVAAVVQQTAWELFKIAIKAAIGIAISALIGYLAPIVANIFVRKLATEFMGEDLGNAVMDGGSAYLSRNHQGGGGLIANEGGYMAALIHQDKVNREEAKTDRLARSPFDYTSANTFAGQLAVALTPIVLQSESIGDAAGNFGKVLGNSIRSLLPTASAISVQDKVNIAKQQTADNCPELTSMGVVADAYCNPYVTTDFTTIELDSTVDSDNPDDYDLESDNNSPYKIVERVAGFSSDNFEEGTNIDDVANPKIKMDAHSPLAMFITYCGQRTSPLGIPDQNIASSIDLDQLDTVSEGVVGAIPIIGDGLSLLSNASVLGNYGYVSGGNCVMNDQGNADAERSDVAGFDPDYEEIKVYSRYVEDQRMAESMGLVEKSAVSIFLDEYYEKHPLDNSLEGILSRFSGLTKDNVIAIEDTVDFYNFYLAYDPTDYYPTPAVQKEDPSYTIEDKDFVNDDGMLAIMRACETDPTRRLNVAAA